ncbi:MAG: glycosyltransferase [Chloroflexota bacterium]
MVDISIVIPAYNAQSTLKECLEALQVQLNPPSNQTVEIIVVDNGSTDQTAEIAAEYGAKLIHEPNKGASNARNAGIKAAEGEIVCFTDADCAPLPDWIVTLTRPLLEKPELIGGKGIYLTQQKSLTARFVQLEYEDKYDLLRDQTYIDFIDTYSAVYRRDALLKFGGFDPEMTYLEDQELSFRLNQHGCKMVFIPEAIVHHYHSDTVRKYFQKKRIIGFWKAQVVRKFPRHRIKDSHTPQVMKVQMGLVMLSIASLFAAPFLIGLGRFGVSIPSLLLQAAWMLPAGLLALFAATTLPFIRKGLPKDQTVARLSPAFLFVRALALSVGYVWGTLRPVKFENSPAELFPQQTQTG